MSTDAQMTNICCLHPSPEAFFPKACKIFYVCVCIFNPQLLHPKRFYHYHINSINRPFAASLFDHFSVLRP